MRNKKLLSTVMAGALMATTVMPVMAGEGSFDVDLTTRSAVIRVSVPTSMAVAVNQFEIGDAGSQIYSNAFTMENKSEIPVKVAVTSTVEEADANAKFLATKKAAVDSKNEKEAWLAVAAQTSDGKYIEAADKTIADLTDADANVATLAVPTGDATAKPAAAQTFYLKTSAPMAYQLLAANGDATGLGYVEFHELTAKTPADQTALDGILAENDVYVGAKTAVDKETLTRVAKGGSHTFDGTNEAYYTADPAAAASVDTAKSYVYGNGTEADGGKAAFRYIGRLSEATETWSKDDITKIKVAYKIGGVSESKYGDVKDDCTYGLYAAGGSAVEVAAASINNGTVSIRLATGLNAVANKITSVTVDGTAKTSGYSVSSSGAVTVSGVTGTGQHTIIVVYDGTTYRGTVTV